MYSLLKELHIRGNLKEFGMDLKKVGNFLKELRKEKGITQERLGEQFGVSGRTVSRWETGAKLPDLDVLVLISDYYGVELSELLDGERKEHSTASFDNDTALKVVDYSNIEKQKLTKRIFYLFAVAMVFFTAYIVIELFAFREGEHAGSFIEAVSGFCLGFSYGALIIGILFSSGLLFKANALKKKFLKKKYGERLYR